jgi:hypothetical protein
MPNSNAFNKLNERLAERLDSRQNSRHAKKILGLLERLANQSEAVEKVRAARNPLDTEAAHSRKVAKAAKRLEAEAHRIDEEINEITVAGYKEISEAIDTRAGLVEGKHAGEIRAALRGLNEKQRNDTMLAAMKEGNSDVIGAVGLAPAILSGLTQERQAHYIDTIRQHRAPELILESEDLAEAFSTAEAARQAAAKMFAANYDSDEQLAIDRAELASSEAEAVLAESTAA